MGSISDKDGFETEVKFRIGDPDGVKKRLANAGAKLVSTGLETNIKYDRDGELRKRKELLRLRTYAGSADITHKRKPKNASRDFKVREETIVRIDDAESGKKLLSMLGYERSGFYEKKREVWVFGSVQVMIDSMPFMGNFVEIEGSEKGIREVAEKLGLDFSTAITKGYGELFSSHCRDNGIPMQDMVFPEDEK